MTQNSTNTHTYTGTLTTIRNSKYSFADVIWKWFWVVLLRMWLSFFPPSIFGSIIQFGVVILAIGATLNWLIIPPYSYRFAAVKPSDTPRNSEKQLPATPTLEQTVSLKKSDTEPREPSSNPRPSDRPSTQPPSQYCSSCGVPHPPEAQYCGMCGTKIG